LLRRGKYMWCMRGDQCTSTRDCPLSYYNRGLE
jgi:hypothetical protein